MTKNDALRKPLADLHRRARRAERRGAEEIAERLGRRHDAVSGLLADLHHQEIAERERLRPA
jgi:hypothetical protein